MLLASERSEIAQYQHCHIELNRDKNVFQDKHLTILHHRKKEKARGKVGLDPVQGMSQIPNIDPITPIQVNSLLMIPQRSSNNKFPHTTYSKRGEKE